MIPETIHRTARWEGRQVTRITGSGWKFVDSRYQARLFNKSATSCRARFTWAAQVIGIYCWSLIGATAAVLLAFWSLVGDW